MARRYKYTRSELVQNTKDMLRQDFLDMVDPKYKLGFKDAMEHVLEKLLEEL